MNKNPIIIVDDDVDDLDIIKQVFTELKVENEIIYFDNGFKFLEYMWTTDKPTFFILCDMNLVIINGLELKRKIYEDSRLRLKCVPFMLSSTMKASTAIMEAYSFGVQGYFVKPNNIKEYTAMIHAMIIYWSYSQHPNS
jgi:response regulator RpfG family c-di-GMP phosphodiesterase